MMDWSDGGLETLTETECRAVLAGALLGRVITGGGRGGPRVVPAPVALVGDHIVFAAVAGGPLDRDGRDGLVVVEADSIDPAAGWSVSVTGVARPVTGGEETELRARPDLTWAADEPPVFLRVDTTAVSGRRILRQDLYVAGTVAPRLSTVGLREDRAGPMHLAPFDGASAEEIPPHDCLHLLAGEEVGRLVVVTDHRPQVFPVNYALDGAAVVFRTGPGTKLVAVAQALVAFEVDRLEGSRPWTVTVRGWAQEITSADGPGLRERLAALHVRPWASGDRLHYVRIQPETITGLRLP